MGLSVGERDRPALAELDAVSRGLRVLFRAGVIGLAGAFLLSFTPLWVDPVPYLHLFSAGVAAIAASGYLLRTRQVKAGRSTAWVVFWVSTGWLAFVLTAVVGYAILMRDFH